MNDHFNIIGIDVVFRAIDLLVDLFQETSFTGSSLSSVLVRILLGKSLDLRHDKVHSIRQQHLSAESNDLPSDNKVYKLALQALKVDLFVLVADIQFCQVWQNMLAKWNVYPADKELR